MLQDLFPRGGQGWHLPKIHGLTQFQTFITLYGSADNFNTDTGESNHRWLVKDTISITQKRKDLLVGQTSHHCYHGLVVDIAASSIESSDAAMYDHPNKLTREKRNVWQGEHTINITSIGIHQKVDAKWTVYRKKNMPCKIDKVVTDFVTTHLFDLGWEHDYKYRAYTEMIFWVDGQYEQFRFCQS